MAFDIVSVIVLNFNGLEKNFLPQCLHSLENQTYQFLEVIVVDNASTDGSLEYIKKEFPNVALIKNDTNLGFCRGNNKGYHVSIGSFVLFANNDTVFAPDSIDLLVKAAYIAPDIGMVSAKLLRPFHENAKTKRYVDSAGLILRRDFTLRDRGYSLVDEGQYNQYAYLFAPCGAAAFYRRSALEAITTNGQLWDESFFAYYEDGDLAWRLQNIGWRCIYVPTAIVEHYRGGSSPSTFFRKSRAFKVHTIKNRYIMVIKNARFSLIIRNLGWLIRQEILIWGYLLLHPALLFALAKSMNRAIPQALKYRKHLQSALPSSKLFEVCPLE